MKKSDVYVVNEPAKLSQTEVSIDTYNLLSLLNVSPQSHTISQTVENFKKAFSWLIDQEEVASIESVAFSGEADPRFWNAVEKELMSALNEGMMYVHCLGPVVCTDENGRNLILETYREYPKNVELYLSRTRALYHWTCFTRRSDGDNKFFFQVYGECYHEPLASTRKEYFIYLLTQDDSFLLNKKAYWYNRQRDYLWRRPIMDKIVDLDQVPTLTLSELSLAYSRIKEIGADFNLLTAKDIIGFLTEHGPYRS